MIRRGAFLIGVLAVSACGPSWRGDETSAVAPIFVADAQLVPADPTDTVNVGVAPPAGSTGAVAVGEIETVGPANEGSYAVVPSAIAEAQLQPVPSSQITAVAPVAPNGSVGLVPVVSAPVATASVSPRPAGVDDASNPIAFALATSHPVGQAIYPRGAGSVDALACGRYNSPVAAQEAFLRAGGPQADGLGLDPDGDGYVCGWSPVPYRTATR